MTNIDIMKMNIRNNVKNLRLKNNMSLRDLASKIGVKATTIFNYEKETNFTTPSIENLYSICNLFGVNISTVMSSSFDENFFSHYVTGSSDDLRRTLNLDKYVNDNYFIYFFKTTSSNEDLSVVCANMKIEKKKIHRDYVYKALFSFPVKIFNGEQGSAFSYDYDGTLSVIGRHTYISLTGITFFEKAQIILHDPPTNVHYLGGIGVISSVAQGRFKTPCVQKIILSTVKFPDQSDIIVNALQIKKDDNQCLIRVSEEEDDAFYKQIRKQMDCG